MVVAALSGPGAVLAQQPANPPALIKDAEATMAAASVSAVVTAIDAQTASSRSRARQAASSRRWPTQR
ncbi:MAG: hypothetical protein JNL68_01000 [Burkholderiales bacterium]|nr:hypothetical protein [Burkholderiales bacterium]